MALPAVLVALLLPWATIGRAAAPSAGSGAAARGVAAKAFTPCPEVPPPSASPTPRPTVRSLPRGVNLSHWDGHPSFGALAGAGIDFLWTEATTGTSFRDPSQGRNLRRGLGHGMLVGSYHFLDYRRDGAAQARSFVAAVHANGGFDERLPPVVDLECYAAWGLPDSTGAVATRLHAFLSELYRLTGVMGVIYAGRYDWRLLLGDDAGFGAYRLWIACWTCRPLPGVLPGMADWLAWQTGSWVLPGVPRRIGANVFAGTADELRELLRRPPRLADRAATTTTTAVSLDLSGSDGAAYRTRVGRGPWSAWQPYATEVAVTLERSLGLQTVSVQLRDPSGTPSPVRSARITLLAQDPDRAPPAPERGGFIAS